MWCISCSGGVQETCALVDTLIRQPSLRRECCSTRDLCVLSAFYLEPLLRALLLLFSHSVISNSLLPHGLQHARLPCPSPTPRACSNSCPFSRWCHPTISSSVVPFSSCPQSFPASGSFPVSQFFTSVGQSTGASASASVLPMNIQDWFPLELTVLTSLLSGIVTTFL